MSLTFKTNDPEPLAIACLIVVHRRIHHLRALTNHRMLTPAQHHVEIKPDCVHTLSQQRRRHHLPETRTFALIQRRRNCTSKSDTSGVVAHTTTLKGQSSAFGSKHVRNS